MHGSFTPYNDAANKSVITSDHRRSKGDIIIKIVRRKKEVEETRKSQDLKKCSKYGKD